MHNASGSQGKQVVFRADMAKELLFYEAQIVTNKVDVIGILVSYD
jgi:hypothetical protein